MWKKVEKNVSCATQVDMRACYAKQKISLACPKSFLTEPNGHHLPKYLYIYITFRKMHIWSSTFKPLSTKM